MADTKTLSESTRSPVDGTEGVRLATSGANWVATLAAIFGTTTGVTDQIKGVGVLTAGATGAGFTIALTTSTVTGTLAAARLPAFTGGDVTSSAGSASLAIGSTKVTSAMLNADVYSTAHSWGAQTFGGAITYGGVTLSNAVTGTGNMVLSASPTLTGTLTYGAGPALKTSPSAAVHQFGAADVASGAVAQFIRAQSNTGTTTTGPDFTWQGTKGTTIGGNLIFQTAATTTYATVLTLTPAGIGAFSGSVTSSGDISANRFLATQDVRVGNGRAFYWNTRSQMTSFADGNITFQNAAATDFGLLQWGGATPSFPALKRSTTVLQARLADDSAFAPLQGALRTAANAVTGLTNGVLSATTNATIVITDASGQDYRVPCII